MKINAKNPAADKETWIECCPCTKSLVKPGFYPGPSLVKKPGYPGS